MGSVAGEYRQREPGASPLYALMEDRFEEFEDVYDDRYADRYGAWRTVLELSLVARASACAKLGVSCGFRERFEAGHPRAGQTSQIGFPAQAEARATTDAIFAI